MTIEINGISQSLIDAVKKVAYDNDYRDQAIQAIKKNIEQGAITPEVGAEQLKVWVTEENLDELSNKTLASYIGKAADQRDYMIKGAQKHDELRKQGKAQSKTLGNNYRKAAVKRQNGIFWATRKIADKHNPSVFKTEETELTELSKKTLGNYVKKAMSQNTIKAAVGGDPDKKSIRQSYKREVGTFRATNRLTGQRNMKEDATPSANRGVGNYTVTGHDGKIHYKGSLDGARSYKSNLSRNLPNTAKKTNIIDTMGNYYDRKDPREKGVIGKAMSAVKNATGPGSFVHKTLNLRPSDVKKDPDLNRKIAKIGVSEALDEAKKVIHPMALHVSDVKNAATKGPVYKVVAKGHKVRGIKVGEHLTDTELDDATEMGHKIKHVNESLNEGARPKKDVSHEAPEHLKNHVMWHPVDYSYFRGKGYNDNEIKQYWDRDAKNARKSGKSPKPASWKESLDEQRSGTFRHKIGDKVLVPKQLSGEDEHQVGTVVHAPSGASEIRVQLPGKREYHPRDGRASQITVHHSEVNPYPYPKAKKKLSEMLGEAKKKGGSFPMNLEVEKNDNKKVHYAYPKGGSDKVHGNKAMDVHMRLHNMGLVGGSMGGEYNKSFWLQPTDKKHEAIIDKHVTKHVPGVKRIKEELADTRTQSTVVEARDRELGHLLLKKVKDMKPSEITKGRKLIPALPIKKPSIKVEDVEADQNILVHLRKTIDTQGKHETLFANGETSAIPAEVAQLVFDHLMKLKPEARGEVQMYMQESFDNVLEVYALLSKKK